MLLTQRLEEAIKTVLFNDAFSGYMNHDGILHKEPYTSYYS